MNAAVGTLLCIDGQRDKSHLEPSIVARASALVASATRAGSHATLATSRRSVRLRAAATAAAPSSNATAVAEPLLRLATHLLLLPRLLRHASAVPSVALGAARGTGVGTSRGAERTRVVSPRLTSSLKAIASLRGKPAISAHWLLCIVHLLTCAWHRRSRWGRASTLRPVACV